MNFNMQGPCDNCPFRTDGAGIELTKGRWAEIRQALLARQGTFPCHKTVDYSKDGGGEVKEGSQHCGGALVVLEKCERPNQMMRIAERLGFYDRSKLDMSAPVAFGPHRKVVSGNSPRNG